MANGRAASGWWSWAGVAAVLACGCTGGGVEAGAPDDPSDEAPGEVPDGAAPFDGGLPEPEPIPEPDPLPDPETGETRTFAVAYVTPGTVSGGVAAGVNLDGAGSGACGKNDYTGLAPESEAGVDNQLHTFMGAVGSQFGINVRTMIEEATVRSAFLAVVEVSGIDDFTNDDEVVVRIYSAAMPEGATLHSAPGNPLRLAPDQAFETAPAPDGEGYGAVVNGRLEATLSEFPFAVLWNGAALPLPIQGAKLRADLGESTLTNATLGGSVPVATLAQNLMVVTQLADWIVIPWFQAHSFGDIGGNCYGMSAGAALEFVPATRLE